MTLFTNASFECNKVSVSSSLMSIFYKVQNYHWAFFLQFFPASRVNELISSFAHHSEYMLRVILKRQSFEHSINSHHIAAVCPLCYRTLLEFQFELTQNNIPNFLLALLSLTTLANSTKWDREQNDFVKCFDMAFIAFTFSVILDLRGKCFPLYFCLRGFIFRFSSIFIINHFLSFPFIIVCTILFQTKNWWNCFIFHFVSN